jgi:hypothetical protein
VLDGYLNFVEDKTEWTGTDITFEIDKKGDKTEVRFTHVGLVPGYECFDDCSNAWGSYINGSLRSLITTGKGVTMTTTHEAEQNQELPQGDLGLLETDLAQRLLASAIPARLAFIWTDGTPRVVPTWFHWTGREVVMVTYVAGPNIGIRHPAARLAALQANPDVALTIDTEPWPPQSLTVRGRAQISEVTGVAPEYAAAARRYLGETAAAEMLAGLDQPGTKQARIAVRPTWVGLLDFATRRPSVLGGV